MVLMENSGEYKINYSNAPFTFSLEEIQNKRGEKI